MAIAFNFLQRKSRITSLAMGICFANVGIWRALTIVVTIHSESTVSELDIAEGQLF